MRARYVGWELGLRKLSQYPAVVVAVVVEVEVVVIRTYNSVRV